MNHPAPPPAAPQRLLLATDLSARCDRALDRAAQLAGQWHAELVALNVLDPSAAPDQTLAWIGGASDAQLLQEARRQLARDLATTQVPATLHVVRSPDPVAAIRTAAAGAQAALVVAGMSRNEALGRFLLGSTVERLARELPLPLLVVRERPRGPYRHIVVTTDFSESSRQALLATADRFPGQELVLYHAHALPGDARVDTARQQAACRAVEATEGAAFLAATPLPAGVRVRPLVECGAVEATLARHVRRHDVDLVVVSSHGRGGLMNLLLGSTAARLLDWLPCDTLLVPAPGAQR